MSAPTTTTELQKVEAGVVSEAKAATSWLLLHERLLITVLLVIVAAFFGNKILDHQATRDKAASDAATSALSMQQAANKQLAAQVATTQQQYQQLSIQLSQQNAQLAQAMQTRTVVLHEQQASDQTIPMPDLGNRWAQLANIQPGGLTATTQGVSVTPDAARSTVSQLEEVPVLTTDVAAEKTENDNLNKEVTASDNLNGLLTSEVSGLNLQLTDETKACSTEVKTLKANARKSKFHLFGIGFGTGFVTGFVVSHVLKF